MFEYFLDNPDIDIDFVNIHGFTILNKTVHDSNSVYTELVLKRNPKQIQSKQICCFTFLMN